MLHEAGAQAARSRPYLIDLAKEFCHSPFACLRCYARPPKDGAVATAQKMGAWLCALRDGFRGATSST